MKDGKIMRGNNGHNLGEIIRQQRVAMSLRLVELSATSGISLSHLCRIERGERFPSARILRKLAKPIGFEENELFALAGYLSHQDSSVAEVSPGYRVERLDPYVSRVLSQEPVEVQRTVIGILDMLKSIALGTTNKLRHGELQYDAK